MKQLVYHCEADVEVIAAAKYYECQRKGLGRIFLRAVHSAARTIRQTPERYPIYTDQARSCRVMGFPFRLIYVICDDGIQILAVMHLHREPGYWKHRAI